MKLTKALRTTIITTAVLTTALGTYAGVQAANGQLIVPNVETPVSTKTYQDAPTKVTASAPVVSDEHLAADEAGQPDEPANVDVPANPAPATPRPTVQDVYYVSAGPESPSDVAPRVVPTDLNVQAVTTFDD